MISSVKIHATVRCKRKAAWAWANRESSIKTQVKAKFYVIFTENLALTQALIESSLVALYKCRIRKTLTRCNYLTPISGCALAPLVSKPGKLVQVLLAAIPNLGQSDIAVLP